ncbi:MAG: cyclic nucleotide-binding domain-containing protein, partial [Myxococcota bacterium]
MDEVDLRRTELLVGVSAKLGHSRTVEIEAQANSHVGQVRDVNEDAFLIDEGLGLYVVCDGMGGHAGGDVASEMAADTLRSFLRQRRDDLDKMRDGAPADEAATWMQRGVQAASATVFHYASQDKARRGMGCTCSAILLLGNKAVMGHVGDSRVYLKRGGEVYQLSEDHTYLREAVKQGIITPEDAAESNLSNVVTRAVGPKPTVMVDTLVFDVLPGDTFLLCSDGLHNYMNRTDELSATLGASDLRATVDQAIETANERGGGDNITALVIRLTSTPAEEPAGTERVTRITQELTILRHVGLFKELEMKELVNVANAFHYEDYGPNEVVVREGDASDTLFILVNGEAVVSRHGTELGRLKAGDHFGEMALLAQRPRSATVTTEEASHVLVLERARFHELLGGQPVTAAKFLWRLAQTLSLRLDDFYLAQDEARPTLKEGQTEAHGLLKSPFD